MTQRAFQLWMRQTAHKYATPDQLLFTVNALRPALNLPKRERSRFSQLRTAAILRQVGVE
jgi:hypothetical protein